MSNSVLRWLAHRPAAIPIDKAPTPLLFDVLEKVAGLLEQSKLLDRNSCTVVFSFAVCTSKNVPFYANRKILHVKGKIYKVLGIIEFLHGSITHTYNIYWFRLLTDRFHEFVNDFVTSVNGNDIMLDTT